MKKILFAFVLLFSLASCAELLVNNRSNRKSNGYSRKTTNGASSINRVEKKDNKTYYRFKNRWTGKYMFASYGASSVEMKAVSPALKSTHWLMEYSRGYYRIKSRSAGKYMHVENKRGYVELKRDVPAGWHSAQWKKVRVDAQHYILKSRWIEGGTMHTENKKGIVQNSKDALAGWHSAQWIIERVASGNNSAAFSPARPAERSYKGVYDGKYYMLQAAHSRKCLDVSGVSRDNGANIHQWDCKRQNRNQHFQVKFSGGTRVQLIARHSGKCVDVSGGPRSIGNGANIVQWDCNGQSNQAFYLSEKTSRGFLLKAQHSRKCLDVSGRSKKKGAKVHQWQCTGDGNQRWRFVNVR